MACCYETSKHPKSKRTVIAVRSMRKEEQVLAKDPKISVAIKGGSPRNTIDGASWEGNISIGACYYGGNGKRSREE